MSIDKRMIKAAKGLVELYRSITQDDLINKDLDEITNFGTSDCVLCLTAEIILKGFINELMNEIHLFL